MPLNTESPRSLIIDSEVLDQPQPWTVYHRGLEYRGEVVFAEVVDPELGLPLRGDVSFRLVFFSVPRRIPSGLIQNPCIAMVVPRHPPERMRRGIGGEMRAVRETRERYRTARDPDAMALRRAMDERDDVLGILTGSHGLPRPLALLYLLAAVRHLRAEVELHADHGLESSRGGRFPGDRITSDLIPDVSFDLSLAERCRTIRLQPSRTWVSVLPYATLIVGDLEPEPEQEARLLSALAGMAPGIAATRQALLDLTAGLGRDPVGAGLLDDLEALCRASGYEQFWTEARDRFHEPSGLDRALRRYQQMQRLTPLTPAIVDAATYLRAMTFGPEHDELSLERDAVIARLDTEALVDNASLWSGIEDGVSRLRARYAAAYALHHGRHHLEAAGLRHRLDEIRPQVQALSQLNRIAELGEPLGSDLQQSFDGVSASITECAVRKDELSLDAAPVCSVCLLGMTDEAPHRDAEKVIGAVEDAFREYNRRLGSEGVRQVLADAGRDQLAKVIGLVHVADPSALANVLDDDVVDFLRGFMKSD